jgi:hypothetical protein
VQLEKSFRWLLFRTFGGVRNQIFNQRYCDRIRQRGRIEEIVRANHPDHSFLGEENVDPGGAASEAALLDALGATPSGWLWVSDPIDGEWREQQCCFRFSFAIFDFSCFLN